MPALTDNQEELRPVCHIVAPAGNMGYGFNLEETEGAVKTLSASGVPTAIIMDAGSTDSGPSKLGLGFMNTLRSSYIRDLSKLLLLVNRYKVPLVFSSAGGDGSDDHVKEMLSVIEEIAVKEENSFKTIAIFSEIKKEFVIDRLFKNKIRGCGPVVPPLEKDDVLAASRIVSQMGPEPFLDAMIENPDFDVIVGGRAYDPAPYIAYMAWKAGASLKETASNKPLWGGFVHLGKILECGGHCATPKSIGASATVYANGTFDVWPNDVGARCTRTSVPAHTLYEKSRPDILHGPGGYLDLNASTYEELDDDKTVRVRGGLFNFSRDVGEPYTLKLEGAKTIGYRCMMIGSFIDPALISQIETLIETMVKPYVRLQIGDVDGPWDIDFNITGLNNFDASGQPGQIFIVGEALATTHELARQICGLARMALCHGPYPGQKATSGNMGWGIGGRGDIDLGLCAQFCIYHLIDTEEGEERLATSNSLFTRTIQNFGKGDRKRSKDEILSSAVDADEAARSKRLEAGTEAIKRAAAKSKSQNGALKGEPKTLGDISRFLRSKNAGPYEVTFDVIFPNEALYRAVKEADILNGSIASAILGVKEDEVVWSGFFDQALAFKITIPRLRKGKVFPNGGYMENDVWAAQKYLPLLRMKLPESFISQWKTNPELSKGL